MRAVPTPGMFSQVVPPRHRELDVVLGIWEFRTDSLCVNAKMTIRPALINFSGSSLDQNAPSLDQNAPRLDQTAPSLDRTSLSLDHCHCSGGSLSVRGCVEPDL